MGKTKKRGGKNEKTEQERQQNTQKRPKNDENLKKVVCSIRKVIFYQWSSDRSATRPIPRITDIWKSSKSHPQLPIDSLQPWSKDSFNFFIFIYLVDALWGQHLYMYKVFWQSQPQQFHPLAGAPAQLNNYVASHKISSEILVVGGSKRKSCWGIIKLLFDRSSDPNCNLACTGTTSYHFLCHKRLWCSKSSYKRKQFYNNLFYLVLHE